MKVITRCDYKKIDVEKSFAKILYIPQSTEIDVISFEPYGVHRLISIQAKISYGSGYNILIDPGEDILDLGDISSKYDLKKIITDNNNVPGVTYTKINDFELDVDFVKFFCKGVTE